MRTSIWRKIRLYILLGLGLFCMMAAILRVVLTFHVSHSQTLTDSYQLKQQGVSAMWTIREDFVAIFVGQAPMVYPIIRRKFWQGVYGTGNESSTENNIGQKYENHQLTAWSTKKPKDRYSITQIGVTMIGQSESQEEMVK